MEEPLAPEEVLLRFKKIIGRDMTPEEKHKFFLPTGSPEVVDERNKLHQRADDNES
jgi:hypothetical protein